MDLVADGGVCAGVWPWWSWECGRPPYMALKSSADEPLVLLHFLPELLSTLLLEPVRWPWWSSRRPPTPRRFPTPTKFGLSSSIMAFDWGQALKFSCLLKMAGNMLNCWWERSSEEVGTEGAGDDPRAPRQDDTPLKSNLMLVQTLFDDVVICDQ